MAAPNIVSVTSIVPHTVSITPADTSRNALVTAPATGATHKINSILVANIDGTTYRSIITSVTVPVGGTVEVITTGTSLYLLDTSVTGEASTIYVTSSTASKLTYTCSYTTIS